MKQKVALAVVALTALAACSDTPTPTSIAAPDQASVAANAEGAPDFVPGEVIVKFRAGASPSNRGLALGRANATAGEHILTATMRRNGDSEGIRVIHTPMNVPDAVAALRNSP